MSIASKVAAKAKERAAALSDQAKSKFNRKYVWYDFSVGLEKAKIKILSCDNLIAQDISKAQFTLVCTLPVQINPSAFKTEYYRSTSCILSGLASKVSEGSSSPTFTFESRSFESNSSIPLIYDIYDEFMARTANETYPDYLGFSLMDEKATSLPILTKYATHGAYYMLFEWGDIRKFGLINGIEVNYEEFSRWGQPLKAVATLYFTEQYDVPKQSQIKGDISSLADTVGEVAGNVAAGAKNIFR